MSIQVSPHILLINDYKEVPLMPSAAFAFQCQRKIVYCLSSSSGNFIYARVLLYLFPHQVEI